MRKSVMQCAKMINLGFRKVLLKYMEWKANKDVKVMQKLIDEFDEGDDYKHWK